MSCSSTRSGRSQTSFEAVVGIADDAHDPSVIVRFRILGDEAVLFEADVQYGEPQEVIVPIGDVLRLGLEYTTLSHSREGCGYNVGSAVFADPVLIGST